MQIGSCAWGNLFSRYVEWIDVVGNIDFFLRSVHGVGVVDMHA